MKLKPVYIEGTREEYSIEPCIKRGTVTVGQLIEILQAYDSKQPVLICNDGGHTYGTISEMTIFQQW